MLRKLHRRVGLLLAPLLLVTAIAGGLLLFRTRGWYDWETGSFLKDLHNYHVVGLFMGVIVAAGLAFMAITGPMLYLQVWLRKRKARKRS